MDDNRAEELVNTTPLPGQISEIVEVLIVDPDPNYISVIINNTFYLVI